MTDWLSAVGGVLGAVGGPAGLWAAWHQVRVDRRRRYGPPEELGGLVGKMIDLAEDVSAQYRSPDWLDQEGGRNTAERIDELSHQVRNQELKGKLRSLARSYTMVRLSDTSFAGNEERRIRMVQDQEKSARRLKEQAEEALALLRRHL
jgi:hypothetical protein